MTLFDAERAARDEAIARADDHADEAWKTAAREAITHVARTRGEFIADAVWETGLPKPREGRALGAIVLWARREGLIAPTDRFQPSAQKGCHAVPRRVWRSLVFSPVQAEIPTQTCVCAHALNEHESVGYTCTIDTCPCDAFELVIP